MNNFEKLKFLFVSVGENTNRLGSVFNTVLGWQVITPAKGEDFLELKPLAQAKKAFYCS